MMPVATGQNGIATPGAPRVTVFIPVYNRERHIGCAVDSVLAQTYGNFELLVLDDGSSDSTLEVLQAYRDPRLRIERNHTNLGLPRTRNRGLDLARGEYFANLDSDDFACRQRLRKQVAFLDQHPEVAVVGSFAGTMDEEGRPLKRIRRRPITPDDIDAMQLFRCGLQNSASTGRTAVLRRFRYREEFDLSEDFDLWVRIAAEYKLANLAEVLVRYRVHDGRTTRGKTARVQHHQRAIFRYQLEALGIAASDDDLERHNSLPRLTKLGARIDVAYLDWADDWLTRLRDANRRTQRFPEPALARVLGWMWLVVCVAGAAGNPRFAVKRFWRSPLRRLAWSSLRSTATQRFLPVAAQP